MKKGLKLPRARPRPIHYVPPSSPPRVKEDFKEEDKEEEHDEHEEGCALDDEDDHGSDVAKIIEALRHLGGTFTY